MLFEEVKKDAIAYAEEVDSAKLLRAVESPELAFSYLMMLANDEDFPTTDLSEKRNDAKTIKKNYTRWNDLNKWIKEESELETPSFYYNLYVMEFQLLSVYPIQALVDAHKADNTIFKHIAELQKAKEAEAAKRKAERAAKKAAK